MPPVWLELQGAQGRNTTVLPGVSPSSVPPYCVYLVLYLQAVGAARSLGVVAWLGNLDTNLPGGERRTRSARCKSGSAEHPSPIP